MTGCKFRRTCGNYPKKCKKCKLNEDWKNYYQPKSIQQEEQKVYIRIDKKPFHVRMRDYYEKLMERTEEKPIIRRR